MFLGSDRFQVPQFRAGSQPGGFPGADIYFAASAFISAPTGRIEPGDEAAASSDVDAYGVGHHRLLSETVCTANDRRVLADLADG